MESIQPKIKTKLEETQNSFHPSLFTSNSIFKEEGIEPVRTSARVHGLFSSPASTNEMNELNKHPSRARCSEEQRRMTTIHSQDFWAILISTARGGPKVALGVRGSRERRSKWLRSNLQALFSSTKVLTLHLLYMQDFMNKPPANRSLKSTSQHHPSFFDAIAQRSANSIPRAKSSLLPVFVGFVSQEWFLHFR